MFKATAEIHKAFTKSGLACNIKDFDTVSLVSMVCRGKQVPQIDMSFLSMNNQNDFTIRVPSYIKVSEGKEQKALELCNRFNTKYRYCKFMVDDKGNIVVVYDVPAKIEDVGAVAVEMLTRFLMVLDEVYPDFVFEMME